MQAIESAYEMFLTGENAASNDCYANRHAAFYAFDSKSLINEAYETSVDILQIGSGASSNMAC